MSAERYCECGCGTVVGFRKDNGEPMRFVRGHNQRIDGPSRGYRPQKGTPAWNKGLPMPWHPHCGRKWPEECHRKGVETRRAKFGGRYTSAEARGWKASPEKRRLVSEANRRRDLSGARNPAWRGGTSFAPYPPEFNTKLKSQVLREQYHLCADCFQLIGRRKGAKRPNVHHRDGDKANSRRDNLVGLCVSCHTTREWQVTRRMNQEGHLSRGRVVPVRSDVAFSGEVVGSGMDIATHQSPLGL